MFEPLPPSPDLDLLTEVFRNAEKPHSEFRLGLESEKFGLTRSGRPLDYHGERGVEGLFARLVDQGFVAYRETAEGPIVALKRGGESITLEPGAQVELSGAPHRNVESIERELDAHLRALDEARPDAELYFLHLGFHPLATPEQLPWVPKLRYPVMRRYLPTRGSRGLDMMQRTATVQVNLDFESEADAMQRLCLLLRMTPFLQALFANSPFIEGRTSPLLSERLDVWLNMDPARSGLIEELWNRPNPRYRDYVEWAIRAPMFLFMRGDVLHQNTGQTFEAFWRDGFEGEKPTAADWKLHLGTLFPEVRLKTTLEVRGVDSQSPALALALPALLAGVCYDTVASDRAWALLGDLTLEEAHRLRLEIRTEGLRPRWKGGSVQATGRALLELASEGLARRAALPGSAPDERPYLAPLWELVERGMTPAEQVVEDHRRSGLSLGEYLPTLAVRARR